MNGPALIELATSLAEELHPGRRKRPVTLESSLENDLGIDSLARVELVLRMEKKFGVSIPDQVVIGAETLEDVLQALDRTSPTAGGGARAPVASLEEVAEAPSSAKTLIEVLEWHAAKHPDRPHITITDAKDGPEDITYGSLLAGAEKIASGLRALDAGVGQPVAIMIPSSRAYFETYCGALLAGAIPVPLYPPTRVQRIEEHVRRQARILKSCRAPVLVTMEEVTKIGGILKSMLPDLRHVTTHADVAARAGARERLHPRPDALALLQYTSGSTGDPKGVQLTHANLLANIRAMSEAAQAGSKDVFVSWLPLYHDMGLIGAWLGALLNAYRLVLMSPLSFIGRPLRWLQAVHDYKGTLSAAPNFAYDLCATRLDDASIAPLDLSSWRLAFNGAEPVHPDTLERFIKRFEPHGFRRSTMTPVYGLAENCLGVTFPPPGRGPKYDRIVRSDFLDARKAVPAEANDPHALTFVSCGLPLPRHEVRILDESGREVPERVQGRLEFSGASATSGYYLNPEATRGLIRGGWVNSGDYAYAADGEIYVTGRVKDLIIRGGRNIHPNELEEAVGGIPGIRASCVAVFGVAEGKTGTEKLVVVAETREQDPEKREALVAKIRELSTELLDAPADDVVLAPPGGVPKTPSGKVRRQHTRELYTKGEIGKVRRGVGLQLVRLAFSGVGPGLRRVSRAVARGTQAVFSWFAVLAVGIPLWLALALLPGLRLRRSLACVAVRLILFLIGTRPSITGRDRLPAGPCILVSNHASYLDALVLTSLLPPRFSYVSKRELGDNFVSGIFLRRLGTEFVDRFDPAQGTQDAAVTAERVKSGASLVVFPEGTFTRAAGLRPFKSGAFVVAAQTGVPVVPVTIRGTRALLRSGDTFPLRGKVFISIESPLAPAGNDFAAAMKLRATAREVILRGCGEPDLL